MLLFVQAMAENVSLFERPANSTILEAKEVRGRATEMEALDSFLKFIAEVSTARVST